MKHTAWLLTFLPTLCAYLLHPVRAQGQEEAWSVTLDSIVVEGHRYNSAIRERADGSLTWDMRLMDDLPKLLGAADPIHYMQMLPGIQTNAEYHSGVHIQGTESSHNYIALGGVPLYNVNHLLGFFSTFNASHYPSLQLRKTATSAAFPNRIGGELEMELPIEQADSAGGEFSVGLISSQGTLRLPLGSRTTLTVSLRGSYINLLYSRWMKADKTQVEYHFFDTNATLAHRLGDADVLAFDFYCGRDQGAFDESAYQADIKATWGNLMGAAHWLHTGSNGLKAQSTLYVTAYRNRFSLAIPDMYFRLPSSITDLGYKGRLDAGGWTAGIEAILHDIRPQSLQATGNLNTTGGDVPATRSFEGTIYANHTHKLCQGLTLDAGVRASLYAVDRSAYGAIDPTVGLRYESHSVQASATYSLRHQYLFQTGFTDAGLPTEFWLSCSRNHHPQYAHGADLSVAAYLAERRFRISADVFYKRLYHQMEYSGSILDYVNTDYDLDRFLLRGEGTNYGFSLMLHKCSGLLNGWASYTYTHARRTFEEENMQGSYPASHERPHEVNAVLTYSPGRHWSFGGSFVYASGTPFTAPVSLLLINGNIIAHYGRHNANRLKPYLRLDLSANYKWKPRFARECGINLSLYNATGRDNSLFYRIKKRNDGAFAYRPVSFVFGLLPSLSYFCKF